MFFYSHTETQNIQTRTIYCSFFQRVKSAFSPQPCVSDSSPFLTMTPTCNSLQLITRFINVYGEHICLWNVKDKSHLNRDIRHKARGHLLSFSNIVSASTAMCLPLAASTTVTVADCISRGATTIRIERYFQSNFFLLHNRDAKCVINLVVISKFLIVNACNINYTYWY